MAGSGDVMNLDRRAGKGYDLSVPAAAGIGRENPMHVRRTSATNGVFLRLKFNGGRCGEVARLAGVLTGRFLTPAFFRRSRCEKQIGGLQIQLGAAP